MCGVVAAIGSQLPSPARRAEALRALGHRGPDRAAERLADGVWLGHTRLSVVAPDDGDQPIASEDGRVVAVVNGEVYDESQQRRLLESRGHRFRTRSDSELVVHLYEEHGESFPTRVSGELACILWDGRERRLVAARDRFGVKPLVWARLPGGGFALASEVKALLALGVIAAWDEQAFLHTARHQYLPPDRTVFSGVYALPPAHVWSLGTGEDPRVRCYWAPEDAAARRGPAEPAEAASAVRDALQRAVDRRLRGDVPVAFALSGGLDSSSILALAQHREGRSRAAFGVCFEHPPYGEGAMARRVAEHVGADFHPVMVRQDDLVDALPDAVRGAESIAINGQLPAKYLLARAIAQAGYRVVLTGEGADETLLGYPHLLADAVGQEGQARQLARLLQRHPESRGVMLATGEPRPDPGLDRVRHRLGYVPGFLRAKCDFGARIVGLLDEDARRQIDRVDPLDDLLHSPYLGLDRPLRAPVDRSACLWSRLALSGYILRSLGDGTEMQHGVEGRPPFLDHELSELSMSLPVSLRVRGGQGKAVLRDAMRDQLPAAITERPKQPFLAPPLSRFGGSRALALVQDVLRSRAVETVPFVDRARLTTFLDGMASRAPEDRAAQDPVLFVMLTATLLGEQLIRRVA